MKQCKILFVGGGNMSSSLIGGLLAEDCSPDNIFVAEPDGEKRTELAARYGVQCAASADQLVAQAEVVVLGVKPQVMKEMAQQLAPSLSHRPLIISVAAGIRESDLAQWLGGETAIVRSMPNTPALVKSGATGLYANPQVTDEQRDLAESIMRAVGITVWLDVEEQMNAVTALSGSGPAYFFLVMEAMEQAAQELGLSQEMAHLLTLQTALGAAKMAMESDETIQALRQRVTSPGGTTEQGLKTLQEGGLEGLFKDALQAACRRSRELAEMLGEA